MNLDELENKVYELFLEYAVEDKPFCDLKEDVNKAFDEFKSSFTESFKKTIVEASQGLDE